MPFINSISEAFNYIEQQIKNLKDSIIEIKESNVTPQNLEDIQTTMLIHNEIKNKLDTMHNYVETNIKEISAKVDMCIDAISGLSDVECTPDVSYLNNENKIKWVDDPAFCRLKTQLNSAKEVIEKKNTESDKINLLVQGVEINAKYDKKLENLSPIFTYIETDEKKGFYTSIIPGVFVKVPFINTISETIINAKYFTIACKKADKCTNQQCTFTHPGQKYRKVGIMSRCPSCPHISNAKTAKKDIEILTEQDIQMLLLYSITDLFIVYLYYSKYKTPNNIFHEELDICK
jgi:hypothetical protein